MPAELLLRSAHALMMEVQPAQPQLGASSIPEVLAAPGICAQIYRHLSAPARTSLAATCSAVRRQVEGCVSSLTVELSRTLGSDLDAWQRQPAERTLCPNRVAIRGSNYREVAAEEVECLLVAPALSQIWQSVKSLEIPVAADAALLEVVARTMPGLQELQLPSICTSEWDQGWETPMAQLTSLKALKLTDSEQDAPPGFYHALQSIPTLCSLTATSSYSYAAIAALTHLQDLTLPIPYIHHLGRAYAAAHPSIQGTGPAVLSQLAALTSLSFITDFSLSPPVKWQEQLFSALTSLNNLHHLELPQIWPGAVAKAVSGMSWLGQLAITQHQPVVPGLLLPVVKVLRLSSVDLGFLDHLKAPHLQMLQGFRESSGVTVLLGKAGLSGSHQKLVAVLERCAGGVLSHCNHLEIDGPCCSGTLMDVLKVLGRSWRPDPTLLHNKALEICTDDKQMADGSNRAPATAAGGWQLTLSGLPVSRTALAALPKGLTHLALKWCQLEDDTLEPLAHLRSLRGLQLEGILLTDPDPLVDLLSSSVQGCLLSIQVESEGMADLIVMGGVKKARARLVAEKGSRNVPVIRFSCCCVSETVNGWLGA